MRRIFLAACALVVTAAVAWAVQPIVSSNGSLTIATGGTYQVLQITRQNYNSITIQNNNTNTDNCFLEVTGLVQPGNTTATSVVTTNATVTAQQASMQLSPGGSYQRYYPYLPRNQIVVTCATSGDSVYVDTQ